MPRSSEGPAPDDPEVPGEPPEAGPSEPGVDPKSAKAVPEPGPFEEFDLTPFRQQLRAERLVGLGMLVVIGAVITVAGIAVASFVAISTGFSWGLVIAIVVLFAALGFLPLALAYVPSREWRYPRTLRIEADGFRLVDSGGRETRFRWDDPSLVLSVRERFRANGEPEGDGRGEYLVAVPYAVCAIPTPARESLMIEAAANGLTVVEDRFAVAEGSYSEPPVPCTTRIAMREYRTDAPGPAAPASPEAPPAGPPTAGTVFELPKKVPPPPERPYDGATRNPLESLTFSETGFSIRLRNGRTRAYDWSRSQWSATIFRYLESPLEPMAASERIWHLRLTSPGLVGEIDGASYAGLLAASRNAGRFVASTRFPAPEPPHSRWIVETSIRSPPGGRRAP